MVCNYMCITANIKHLNLKLNLYLIKQVVYIHIFTRGFPRVYLSYRGKKRNVCPLRSKVPSFQILLPSVQPLRRKSVTDRHS